MKNLLPLIGKSLPELTLDDLRLVNRELKLGLPEMTEELKTAGMALLAGDNINTVSDLISNPKSIEQLLSFFKRGGNKTETGTHVVEKAMIRCKHCNEVQLVTLAE